LQANNLNKAKHKVSPIRKSKDLLCLPHQNMEYQGTQEIKSTVRGKIHKKQVEKYTKNKWKNTQKQVVERMIQ